MHILILVLNRRIKFRFEQKNSALIKKCELLRPTRDYIKDLENNLGFSRSWFLGLKLDFHEKSWF